jgi:hypothetical protein
MEWKAPCEALPIPYWDLMAGDLASSSNKLVKENLSDLEVQGPSSFKAIVANAASLGLRPCLQYLGAAVRLECLHQPEGPYLRMASP